VANQTFNPTFRRCQLKHLGPPALKASLPPAFDSLLNVVSSRHAVPFSLTRTRASVVALRLRLLILPLDGPFPGPPTGLLLLQAKPSVSSSAGTVLAVLVARSPCVELNCIPGPTLFDHLRSFNKPFRASASAHQLPTASRFFSKYPSSALKSPVRCHSPPS